MKECVLHDVCVSDLMFWFNVPTYIGISDIFDLVGTFVGTRKRFFFFFNVLKQNCSLYFKNIYLKD